jgi:hypothetical protein
LSLLPDLSLLGLSGTRVSSFSRSLISWYRTVPRSVLRTSTMIEISLGMLSRELGGVVDLLRRLPAVHQTGELHAESRRGLERAEDGDGERAPVNLQEQRRRTGGRGDGEEDETVEGVEDDGGAYLARGVGGLHAGEDSGAGRSLKAVAEAAQRREQEERGFRSRVSAQSGSPFRAET